MTELEQIALLEQKNKSLSNELDKITTDLFKMQDQAAELTDALENKKHSEQLAGWAMDRALEFCKNLAQKPQSVSELTQFAQEICDGVKLISASVANQPTEEKGTMQ